MKPKRIIAPAFKLEPLELRLGPQKRAKAKAKDKPPVFGPALCYIGTQLEARWVKWQKSIGRWKPARS